ncbi:uncharacterized protein [Primulina huaijiensis]|uniref:uncharacterized protein n=1 Tax=Primulina huaijiensis TaxID=1492673 RepID=UPI003CC6F9FF
MTLFEALYGQRGRSRLCWDEFGEKQLIEPDIVQEIHDKFQLNRQRMEVSQDRQASYANKCRLSIEFQAGDFVFLKISQFMGVVHFGIRGKLSPRYVRPYDIVERIGIYVYRLELPQSLPDVHDVFRVSMLRKYEPDSSHLIYLTRMNLISLYRTLNIWFAF